MKIAFVDRRATIATTITSVELENAVGVATVRRNARMASVEKTATLARTIGSVILMSVAIRPMTLVSWQLFGRRRHCDFYRGLLLLCLLSVLSYPPPGNSCSHTAHGRIHYNNSVDTTNYSGAAIWGIQSSTPGIQPATRRILSTSSWSVLRWLDWILGG